MAEERWRRIAPFGLREPVFGWLARVYPDLERAPRVLRAKATFRALSRDSVDAYFDMVSVMRAPARARMFNPAFKSLLGGYRANDVFHRHAARAQTDDPLALIQYLDLHTYLVGDINTKVDRASMAHSLETREPLMDHVLVEWMATLPSRMKLGDYGGKHLLKRAMDPYLDQELLHRRKMGFAVPLARWFRGPLRQRVRDAVLGPQLAGTGWFDSVYLHQLVDAHQSGARDNSAALWSLLMFDAFLRNVDSARVPNLGAAA